jgi:hypothetical protein
MSKSPSAAGLSFVIAPRFAVLFVHETNHARAESKANPETGAGKDLVQSFLVNGWDVEGAYGTVLGELVTEKLHPGAKFPTGKALIDYVVKERTSELDRRQKAYDTADEKTQKEAMARLTAYKALYCDKDGKIAVPKIGECFWATDGHQRDKMSLRAAELRVFGGVAAKGGEAMTIGVDTPTGLDDLNRIPVRVVEFENELDRTKKQIAENQRDSVGKTNMSIVDNLVVASELFAAGYSQAHLRKVFKDGEGQRLHGVLTLSMLHPEAKLVQRMRMEWNRVKDEEGKEKLVAPPEWISYRGVKHADLPLLIKRSDPAKLKEENDRRDREAVRTGKPQVALTLLTRKELEEEVIPNWNGVNRVRQPKGMDKTQLEQIAGSNENPIVQRVIGAVKDNRPEALQELHRHARIFADVDYFVTSHVAEVGEKGQPIGSLGKYQEMLHRLNAAPQATVEKVLAQAVKALPEVEEEEEEVAA